MYFKASFGVWLIIIGGIGLIITRIIKMFFR